MAETRPRLREVYYHERQHAGQWWIWLAILPLFGLSWYALIAGVILSGNLLGQSFPNYSVWIIWAVFGVFVPLFLGTSRMITTVFANAIEIRYFPLLHRVFGPQDINSYYIRTYRPFREYGGWGVRWSPVYGWAYDARGRNGVQLELATRQKLLIGTRHPEELAAALDRMTGGKRLPAGRIPKTAEPGAPKHLKSAG